MSVCADATAPTWLIAHPPVRGVAKGQVVAFFFSFFFFLRNIYASGRTRLSLAIYAFVASCV